jgi:MoaA/NifB/PqqE/SkfB family radical SAM enzyme
MSKVRIVNWILTRKCNLKCDYCAIVKDYQGKPDLYPNMSHYIKNEMSTELVIAGLREFKCHNPNAFHIFYGGEPLLRKDLPLIINYCNDNNIVYTIISNNTPEIQKNIKRLFEETDHIEGFTSSVDPVLLKGEKVEDSIKKSIEGLKRLKEIQKKGKVKDVVAEITVMNHNKHLLYDLVKELSQNDIYSDITFVDIAKTPYYDFSNVRDPDQLVIPTDDLKEIFERLNNDSSLLIHMKDFLLPEMFKTLPSNFDCYVENNAHNLTIDADGSVRLCLRIRGTVTPAVLSLDNLFSVNQPGKLSTTLQDALFIDKNVQCKLCNHSCLMMSKYIDESEEGEDDLIHSDKRRKD